MKHVLLVWGLLLCLAAFVSASVTTSLVRTLDLEDGNTLVTLRATFGGLEPWPTSPPTQYFVVTVSSESLSNFETDYYVPATAERTVEFDIIVDPGSYEAWSIAYWAPGSYVGIAFGGMPLGSVTWTVDDRPLIIPTLSIAPPLFDLEVIGNDVHFEMAYSYDNIVGIGGVYFTFEIWDVYDGEERRYYTNLHEFDLKNIESGIHAFAVRVLVFLESGGVGYSPLSSIETIDIFPFVRLLVPWFAWEDNLWDTLLVLSCKENDIPIEITFTSYRNVEIGGQVVQVEDTFSMPGYSSKFPIMFAISDVVVADSGYLVIEVDGTDAGGISVFYQYINGGPATFDATPMLNISDIKGGDTHISGQYVGDVMGFHTLSSTVLINTTVEEKYVLMEYNIAPNSCLPIGRKVVMAEWVLPYSTKSVCYDQESFAWDLGLPFGCPDPYVYSIKIVADEGIYAVTGMNGLESGLGIWFEY